MREGRRRSVLIWIALAAVAGVAWAGSGVWTSGGPDGGPVVDLVFDPATSATIYAATRHNAVFRSTDAAASWAAAGAGLPRPIRALAIAADGTLYAAGELAGPGLFKSTDDGSSWQQVLGGFITAVAADPSSSATVYAGTSGGAVSKTTDAGANWVASSEGLPDVPVLCLVVDPQTPATVYLCSEGRAAFKSTDGGVTWTSKNRNISGATIESMVIDPVTSTRLYIASTEGLFRTSDGAETWNALSDPQGVFVRRLAIDSTTPTTLLGGGFGTILRSTNRGSTWSQISTGVPPAELLTLAVDPSSSSTFYAGTGAGVIKSSDTGATWSPVNQGLRSVRVDRVAADPVTGGTIYAASSESGIFKSTDGGVSWAEASSGLGDRAIADLALAPSAPENLFAAQTLGFRSSSDGGAVWSDPVTDPEDFGILGPAVVSLAVDPLAAGTVFAVNGGPSSRQGGGPGVLRSTDSAVSWERVFEPDGLAAVQPGDVAVDPLDPTRVLFSFGGVEVGVPGDLLLLFRSLDGGGTWTEVLRDPGPGIATLAFDPLAAGTAYAVKFPGAGFEVLRSVDGGASWSPLTVTAPCVNDLLPDPATAATLWVACDPVYTSTDGGASWSMFDDGGFPAGVGGALTLAFAQGAAPTLHAGTPVGVYSYSFTPQVDLAVSKDDGVTEVDPGGALTYTIVVTNLGPAPATGANVSDDLPAELTCTWSCVGAGGGVCDPAPPAGDLDESVDLPVGATVTFTASCTVDSGAGGFLTNSAVGSPPVGSADPDAGNDVGADTDVVLEMGACGTFNDRHLSEVTFSTPATVEACFSITAGPAVEVASDVVFRAPLIVITELSVTSGSLTMINEVPTP